MKSDHRNTPAALKPRSKHSQALFERAKLVIYLHPQRLKHLGSRMMTAVTSDQFFDRARQRQSFAKRCSFSHLYNQACDTTRCRLLSQFAKQPRQLFLAVFVYDRGSGQLGSRIHAHIEGTVSHEAESPLGVFELPGRNTNIKKHAPNRANSKFIEEAECAPKIRLSHRKAFAEACQLLTDVLDRVGIPVERKDVGPALQKRFGVATATTCGIYDERA